MAVDYVDNKKLYAAMCVHIAAYRKAKEDGTETPRISNYIADCIQKIADGVGEKGNFVNYTYKEDMIGDGVENCLRYLHNFDPEKSKSPFSYFTTIIWYAFLRRIDAEKKQTYIKYKQMESTIVEHALLGISLEDMKVFETAMTSSTYDIVKMTALTDRYKKKDKIPKEIKKIGLEKFMEDEDNEDNEYNG
jgi:hypothetical protein